jgi:uncharacterized membrane protein HdeD (DUF308 family)
VPTTRPIQITLLAYLFILVGIVSTAVHLFHPKYDLSTIAVLLIGLSAIVAGIFLLRGASWARWFLLFWLAFHVVVSALNSVSFALPHIVLLALVAYLLLRSPASQFFQRSHTPPQQ